MAQEVLEDPWVAWEAVEETEEASLQEGPEVPGGTPQEEEMSSTELETGSVPIRMYFAQQIDSVLVMTPYAHSGTGPGVRGDSVLWLLLEVHYRLRLSADPCALCLKLHNCAEYGVNLSTFLSSLGDFFLQGLWKPELRLENRMQPV